MPTPTSCSTSNDGVFVKLNNLFADHDVATNDASPVHCDDDNNDDADNNDARQSTASFHLLHDVSDVDVAARHHMRPSDPSVAAHNSP